MTCDVMCDVMAAILNVIFFMKTEKNYLFKNLQKKVVFVTRYTWRNMLLLVMK
jgi:uncharacterized membrane protein